MSGSDACGCQGKRPDRPAASASKKRRDDGHCPPGVYDVVNQKDRPAGQPSADREHAVKIPALMVPVLLQILRLVFLDLRHNRLKGKFQCLSQPPRVVGNQALAPCRRHTCNPVRSGTWSPSMVQHVRSGIHEFVAKAPVMLVRGDQGSPACIAPSRKDPPGIGAIRLGQIRGEVVFLERTARDLLVAFQGKLRLAEKPCGICRDFAWEGRINDWAPDARGTFATWLGVNVVKRLGQKLHQAPAFSNIFLHFVPLGFPADLSAVGSWLGPSDTGQACGAMSIQT